MKHLFKLLRAALLIGAIGFVMGACSSPAGGPPNDGLEGTGTATVNFGTEANPDNETAAITISPDYTWELDIAEGSAHEARTTHTTGKYTINDDNTITLKDESGITVGVATIKDGKMTLEFDENLGGGYGGLKWNFTYDGKGPGEGGPGGENGLDPKLVGKWYSTAAEAAKTGGMAVLEITGSGKMTQAGQNAGEITVTTSGGKITATYTLGGVTSVDKADYTVVGGTKLRFSNVTNVAGGVGVLTRLKAALDLSLSLGGDGYYHKGTGGGSGGGGNFGPVVTGPVTSKLDGVWKGTVKVKGQNYTAYATVGGGEWSVTIPEFYYAHGSYTLNLSGSQAALKNGDGDFLGTATLKNSDLISLYLNSSSDAPGTYPLARYHGEIPGGGGGYPGIGGYPGGAGDASNVFLGIWHGAFATDPGLTLEVTPTSWYLSGGISGTYELTASTFASLFIDGSKVGSAVYSSGYLSVIFSEGLMAGQSPTFTK